MIQYPEQHRIQKPKVQPTQTQHQFHNSQHHLRLRLLLQQRKFRSSSVKGFAQGSSKLQENPNGELETPGPSDDEQRRQRSSTEKATDLRQTEEHERKQSLYDGEATTHDDKERSQNGIRHGTASRGPGAHLPDDDSSVRNATCRSSRAPNSSSAERT